LRALRWALFTLLLLGFILLPFALLGGRDEQPGCSNTWCKAPADGGQ
jgi:hypothetical protein